MITLNLTPELETVLMAQANQQGTTPELLAIATLQAHFANGEAPEPPPTGTLADYLGSYIGCIDSGKHIPGGAALSEKTGQVCRRYVEEASRRQTLMLTDTGPLIALLDSRDPHHAKCVGFAATLPAEPLETTWPCFTEAMYLLGEVGGFTLQQPLWGLLQVGKLQLHLLASEDCEQMSQLMEKYRDTPMDLADASLVAIAERHGFRKLFSLDSDFYVYRLSDGSVLESVP